MSGSNLMLTICALLLFGLFAMGGRTLTATNSRIADHSEYSLTAISVAQSIIDEAKTKAFDHRTTNRWFSVPPDSFSTALGPDISSEIFTMADTSSSGAYRSATKYNDIDDYNHYVRVINSNRARGYVVSVEVNYVNESDPESLTSSRTNCKRMDVSVTCPAMSQLNAETSEDALPIRLSYVFAY